MIEAKIKIYCCKYFGSIRFLGGLFYCAKVEYQTVAKLGVQFKMATLSQVDISSPLRARKRAEYRCISQIISIR